MGEAEKLVYAIYSYIGLFISTIKSPEGHTSASIPKTQFSGSNIPLEEMELIFEMTILG